MMARIGSFLRGTIVFIGDNEIISKMAREGSFLRSRDEMSLVAHYEARFPKLLKTK